MTAISRDTYGKPLSITRSGLWNGSTLSVTRRFVYDARQRLCKHINPESGATLMEYDVAGNLLWSARSSTLTQPGICQTESVPAASKSFRTWDARNRLTAVNHPAGTANESFTYYADGALKTASNAEGGTWSYTYNKRRLLESETLAIGGRNFIINYAWNSLGHLSTLVYPSGLSVSLDPNAMGQLRRAGAYAANAKYHPDGSLKSFINANGISHSRYINTRGLPERINDYSTTNLLLSYVYTYDKSGNITSIVDQTTPEPWNESRTLSYDARDRLVSAIAPHIYGEEIYEYDPLDNVRRLAAYPNASGGYVLDYRYQYSASSNRLARINDPQGALQWSFSHNNFGEALTRSGHNTNWSYQWNQAGRITRVNSTASSRESGPGLFSTPLFSDGFESATSLQHSESHVYDAHGRRTRSQRSGGSTRYQVYNRAGALLYVEDSQGNQGTDYIHLGPRLVAQRSRNLSSGAGTITYHHVDPIGNANIETNAGGVKTRRTFRMPYGSPYNGQYHEGPGYAGHFTDNLSRLTYMQQRYYDPVALRFLSPDQVHVDPASGSNFNRYWYADNNPFRYVDPDGLYRCMGTTSECEALERARKLASKFADSKDLSFEDKQAARSAVDFYGEPGEPGVDIEFRSLSGAGAMNSTNTSGAGVIAFDLNQIQKTLLPKEDIAHGVASDFLHEGDHGARIVSEGYPKTRAERLDRERSAYWLESVYQRVTGVYAGAAIWAPYLSNDDIERKIMTRAIRSVERSCRNSKEGS